MSRAEFEGLLTSDPESARHYLKALFERLRTLSARVAALEGKAAPAPAAVLGGPVALPGPPGEVPAALSVVVMPLTRQAAQTLPDDGLRVLKFPLRIGRAGDPDEPGVFDLNDLWLLDRKPYNVSRNHCAIELEGEDRVIVHDRGSHLGCFVNEEHIGGRSPFGFTHLHPGENVLVLGGRSSPYQFRVTVGA